MLPLFILLLMLFLRVKDPDSLIPLHFSKTYVVLVSTLPNHNVGTQRSFTRSSHHSIILITLVPTTIFHLRISILMHYTSLSSIK